jgi:preprotein translocase subunit YajC
VKQLGSLLPFILIALVFWLLIVRPQRRRQQELNSTQASLAPGSQVMLGSGIFGTVASLDDETVYVEVAPGTTIKVAKQAVTRVISGPESDEHDVAPPTNPSDEPSDEPSERNDQ